MNVEFLDKFGKDIDRINQKSVKNKIEETIELVKKAKKLNELKQIKKLKGFDNAYRLRIGDYRIGFFFENDTIEFARVAHRKEIYRIFP